MSTASELARRGSAYRDDVTWSLDTSGVVELPDGRRVCVRGLRHGEPTGERPQIGYYLLGSSPPQMDWPAVWIRWPDFRLPSDRGVALATLCEAHRRCADERVELACGGGIGRSGSALAVLARLSGVPAEDAVTWTRAHLHRRAVETPWQRRWVRNLELPSLA